MDLIILVYPLKKYILFFGVDPPPPLPPGGVVYPGSAGVGPPPRARGNLEILEYCEQGVDPVRREQYYFGFLKPEDNILEIAGSSLGFKHSE